MIFSRFVLLLCFLSFVSCTTLTGAERCALIGQIQTGTQIGTSTNIQSIGDSVYSYKTTEYNPICTFPKTTEEKETVEKLSPIAKEKHKESIQETYVVSFFGMVFALAVVLIAENFKN